jgi:hypothetical protein
MAPVSVRTAFGHGAASLERTRAGVGSPRPASLRQLADAFGREVTFDEPIVTDEPLGGHHTLTVRRDGSWRYRGHFRATGFPSFEVSILTTLGYPVEVPGAEPAAAQVAFAAKGEVHGTNEPGDREFAWDQSGQLGILASEWAGVRRSTLQRRVEFDTDWFGVAGDVVSFLGQVIVFGSTFGAAGVAIVLAGEAAEQLHLDGLVLPGTVGILLAAGAAFVFGPGVLFPVFLVGAAVTAALVKQRHLTAEERQFVDRVFQGTLPMDRVLLTNLVGLGGRPFTAPGPGGAILVNVGEGFDDPVNYTGKGGTELGKNAKGQLLIHELTHAWQIANESFTPGYYCRALSTAIGTVGGDMSAYQYGPSGPPWGSFGTEQQAAIVDEWFAGSDMPDFVGKVERQREFPPRHDKGPGEDPANPKPNPYFRYVRDNIRAGIA